MQFNLNRSFFNFSRTLLLGIVHSLLVLPVLYLFLEINELPGFYSFAGFFVVTQLVAAVIKKRWLYFLFEGLALFIFYYFSFPSLRIQNNLSGWFDAFVQEGQQEWTSLVAGSTVAIPVHLISLALLLLIILVTYSGLYQKITSPSFLIVFGYLLLIHTFTGYAILPYTVSAIGFGLLFIGLARVSEQMGYRHFFKSSILTTLLTVAVVLVAYFSLERLKPVQSWIETTSSGYQQTLDREGFFDWVNDQSPRSRFKRTGMSTNDKRLGGPLQNDYTRVFKAYTDKPHYWKVLHRRIYIGTGWNSDSPGQYEEMLSPYLSAAYNASPDPQAENATATLVWETPLEYLALPYGWSELNIDDSLTDYSLSVNRYTEHHLFTESPADLSTYTVSYDSSYPGRLDESLLKQDDGWRKEFLGQFGSQEGESYNPELPLEDQLRQFIPEELQRPDDFPQRVVDLANELTAGIESEYEMVRAIESYLKSEGRYRYSMEDAAQTPPGRDYVEYFLFDTLVGYCDNFSTAMTMMLRSVGIPARWAKGFTPGSQQTNSQGESYYQISNSNAHSWVEVYFPSAGWVPFEPSPTFASPVTRTEEDASPEDERFAAEQRDTQNAAEAEAPPPEPEAPEPETEEAPEPEEPEAQEETAAQEESASADSPEETTGRSVPILLAAGLILLIAALVFFSVPLYAAGWILKKMLQYNKLSLTRAVSWILRLFEFKRKRAADQTVQSYLQQWNIHSPSQSSTLESFGALADECFYGRNKNTHLPAPHQKEILLATLQIYQQHLSASHFDRLKKNRETRSS